MTAPTPRGTVPSAAQSRPAGPPPVAAPLLAAAQGALAAEYQAVWGYPMLGPRLTDPAQVALARAADDAHAALAGALEATLAGLGATPAAPLADYPLPSAVADAPSAVAYAVELETAAAAAWRFVVVRSAEGADAGGLKATAVDALSAAAVRAARWRAVLRPAQATVAFPGT